MPLTERVIRCTVASESYAVRIGDVRSLERADELRPAPEGAWTEGWLPDGDGEIPVHSLGSWLGIPAAPAGGGQVLVVGAGGTRWGLRVDRVSRVLEVGAEAVLPLPGLLGAACASVFDGVLTFGEEFVLRLSSAALRSAPSRNAVTPGEAVAPAASATSARARSDGTGTRTGGRGRIVVFSASRQRDGGPRVSFALSLSQVSEILGSTAPTRVPFAPSWLLGLIGRRGQPVPLVDLSDRLGLGRSQGAGDRVLVARLARGSRGDVAFPILADVRNQRVPDLHADEVPGVSVPRHLTLGVFPSEHGPIVVPDLGGIAGSADR